MRRRAFRGNGCREEIGAHVLLAEDARDIQRLIGRFLQNAGLKIDFADNGLLAVEKAAASAASGNAYDLILVDVQMPEMDGYEATRRLRQNGWKGPIVALTAHATASDRRRCLEAGCDDYVSKPVSPQQLIDTITRHLE